MNLSVALIRFVQRFHTTVVGTNGAAVGEITIYQNGDANRVYSIVTPGSNISVSTMRMVPLGQTFYITSGYVTATEKSVAIRLLATADAGVLLPDIFINQGGSWFLKNSTLSKALQFPIALPELSIVKLTVFVPATKAGADVSAGIEGWIE